MDIVEVGEEKSDKELNELQDKTEEKTDNCVDIKKEESETTEIVIENVEELEKSEEKTETGKHKVEEKDTETDSGLEDHNTENSEVCEDNEAVLSESLGFSPSDSESFVENSLEIDKEADIYEIEMGNKLEVNGNSDKLDNGADSGSENDAKNNRMMANKHDGDKANEKVVVTDNKGNDGSESEDASSDNNNEVAEKLAKSKNEDNHLDGSNVDSGVPENERKNAESEINESEKAVDKSEKCSEEEKSDDTKEQEELKSFIEDVIADLQGISLEDDEDDNVNDGNTKCGDSSEQIDKGSEPSVLIIETQDKENDAVSEGSEDDKGDRDENVENVKKEVPNSAEDVDISESPLDTKKSVAEEETSSNTKESTKPEKSTDTNDIPVLKQEEFDKLLAEKDKVSYILSFNHVNCVFIHLYFDKLLICIVCLFVHSFIYLFIHSFIYSFICLFIHSFVHLFIHSSVCSQIYTFYMSIYLSLCHSVHPCIHSSAHPSIHPSFQSYTV